MRKTTKKETCAAVIVAAGSGRRMKLDGKNDGVNKVFLQLGDRPVLAHTLCAFEKCAQIEQIVVVTRESDIALCSKLADEFEISKLKCIISGGDTRQESVLRGLEEIEDEFEYVLIHDGARCLIETSQIQQVALAVKSYGAAALGIPCSDSLKRVDENENIIDTIDRKGVYRIQTPQAFLTGDIIRAHRTALEKGIEVTDDCSVAELVGIDVKIVEGSVFNIKLTTQEDLILAEAIMNL